MESGNDLREIDLASTRVLDVRTNKALSMAEFKAGVLRVNSTPQLTLATSSRCNLRCVMCPHSIGAIAGPKDIDEEILVALKKFIQQAGMVQLHGAGEPLLAKAFWRALDYISPDSDEVSINTNFVLADEERINRLLNSNLCLISDSLDAATPLTYRRIRGACFDTVVDNIRKFIEVRRQLGKTDPKMYLNMTMMRSNIEEVPAFVNLAADLGADRVVFGHLNRYSDEAVKQYRFEREGWKFDYAAEGLWHFPELSNRMIREGQMVAKARGIDLELDGNKDVFFDEESLP